MVNAHRSTVAQKQTLDVVTASSAVCMIRKYSGLVPRLVGSLGTRLEVPVQYGHLTANVFIDQVPSLTFDLQ